MKLHHLLIMTGMLGAFAVSAQTPPPAAPRPMAVAITAGSGSFLGVGIQEIDGERAKELKLKDDGGVEVTRVDENSPAEKAGLRSGDVIVDYSGQHVEGIDQFSRLVRETPAGREVKLEVLRNGARQAITAKIGSRRTVATPAWVPEMPPIPDMPRTHLGWRSSLLGIEAEQLDGQLAEFFGVKEGVLVRSVTKGSAAEKAGIRAGDVITRVDNMGVSSPSDITGHLRSMRGKTVSIVLMRDRKEVSMSVPIPTDDRSEYFYAKPFGRPALL
jgi:serine protease Do